MTRRLPSLRRRGAASPEEPGPGETPAFEPAAPMPSAPSTPLASTPAPVVQLRQVVKTYGTGDAAVHALTGPLDAEGRALGLDLTIQAGDFVAVMDSSGSGKSTLMNIVGCLDAPTSGRYLLDGIDVGNMDEHQLSLVRNRKVGFVFQSFNLVPRMTVVDQVELPLTYAGVRPAERRRRVLAAVGLVGLMDRAEHLPHELSGGQQQRVAVARALVMSPSMLLADEPTGNLDSQSTIELMSIIDRLNAARRTVVLITHEDEVARHAKRVVRLVDGRIVSDVRQAPLDGLPPALADPEGFAGHSHRQAVRDTGVSATGTLADGTA
ncbi:ABC transporter ATP-binding protein [Streptacidiphilus melanogenes]|uniref:ABC transporter ATP-binding protein n=1 Tax=Streptacidiphilus melanogenes TaxID=411235 RepID=UPI000AF8C728|nr:ABC transporter ATP-binding protein [Streptacidiphilus melanogenes]